MKITRGFNGQTIEIELTSQELYEAYLEKQNEFDRQDIEDVFNGFDDDELEDMYGMTRAQLEEKIPEFAHEMRRNIDKYDMSWQGARDATIAENCN